MKVHGVEITGEQIDAGLAAMRVPSFKAVHVVGALMRAGVTGDNAVADRAADRLLQKERKAGRIRAVNNKNWEPCS